MSLIEKNFNLFKKYVLLMKASLNKPNDFSEFFKAIQKIPTNFQNEKVKT